MDNEQRASVPNNELGETALAMVMGLVNNTETPPAETPAPAPPVQPPAAPPVQPPAAPPVQPPAAPPAQPVQEAPVLTTDMMADRFSGAPQTPPMSELPDIPAEQSITLPNNTPENVGHAFAASRAEARRYRELAEDMRKQLEAERGQREDYSKKEAEFTRRLAEAQQRQTDLENQIGQLDLAQSKEFRDKYDAPVQGVCDDIAKVLMQNGATPQDAQAQAEEILSTSDVAPLLTELPATAQGMVMYKLEEAKSLLAQREAALNEWRTTQQGLAEVSLRDSAIVSAQRRAEVADAAFDRLKAIAPTMQWNDPEYAPRRDAAVAKAKAWYQTAPEDQIAAAAMEGFLAPFAYEELNRLTQQNRELRELLAGRARMASPPVAPLYPSAPIIAPPAPPPPTPGTPGQPWSPADSEVDSLRSATRIVESLAAAR